MKSRKEQELFTLSIHAQKRMYERFPDVIKEVTKGIVATGLKLRRLYKLLWDSTPEKSIFNDTRFMAYVYEKHGYDKNYRFFVNGPMLFIGVVEEKNYIVTVINRNTYNSHVHETKETRKQRFRTKARPPMFKKRSNLSNSKRKNKNECMEDF